jgi:hypothetical protein
VDWLTASIPSAPAADPMPPMPPAVAPLPPAAPTAIATAHVAMWTHHRDIRGHRARRFWCETQADRQKSGDGNNTRQHIFQDLTATAHHVVTPNGVGGIADAK